MKLLKRLAIILFVFLLAGFLFFFRQEEKLLSPFLKVEEEKKESVSFAVMADVHNDWVEFEQALAVAKEKEPEFVIVAGDLTNLGKREELEKAKETLDKANLNYFVIPGNHDLWFGNKIKADVFNEVFGNRFQSFKKDKIKFILIDNGSYSGLREDQFEWLKNEVAECRIFYCLAFAHMPLNHGTSEHIMGEDDVKAASDAANLVKLFVSSGVKKLFAGHLHYQTSYTLDGLETTLVGAITRDRSYQIPRFMMVEKTGEELKQEVILVDRAE